jgi:hypothetical protein
VKTRAPTRALPGARRPAPSATVVGNQPTEVTSWTSRPWQSSCTRQPSTMTPRWMIP